MWIFLSGLLFLVMVNLATRKDLLCDVLTISYVDSIHEDLKGLWWKLCLHSYHGIKNTWLVSIFGLLIYSNRNVQHLLRSLCKQYVQLKITGYRKMSQNFSKFVIIGSIAHKVYRYLCGLTPMFNLWTETSLQLQAEKQSWYYQNKKWQY